MKKIIICVTLSAILAAGMTGCSNKQDNISAEQSTAAGATQQPSTQSAADSAVDNAGPSDVQNTVGEAAQNANEQETAAEASVQQNDLPVSSEAKFIVYKNTQFGFEFTLPVSWENYQIITEKWEGASLDQAGQNTITETGPLISIRHPEWTSQNPRQDIPIMVFTLKQWDAMQKGEFHIGAAPINPSELGRNNKYVFALPARYNYAFPAGFEEVDKIIQSHALKPITVK